jgi:hypothetical protein
VTAGAPILASMAQCTAPVRGHRSSSAAANCPACSSRSSYSTYRPSYSSLPRYSGGGPSSGGSSGGGSLRSGSSSGGRSRRLRGGGSAGYTAAEWRTFEPLVRAAEAQAHRRPENRDLFLCHAWDDRNDAARAFYDDLVSLKATVWFSETEVGLGTSLMREIDRGLAMSRIGIVFVTPALLTSLVRQGVADKELSALLATERVIPVAYGTTFEALRDVSPYSLHGQG